MKDIKTFDVREKGSNRDVKYQNIFVIHDKDKGDGEKISFWTKVGVAFENKDGSYSLDLSALPVGGRLHMRKPRIENSLES